MESLPDKYSNQSKYERAVLQLKKEGTASPTDGQIEALYRKYGGLILEVANVETPVAPVVPPQPSTTGSSVRRPKK